MHLATDHLSSGKHLRAEGQEEDKPEFWRQQTLVFPVQVLCERKIPRSICIR